MTTAAKMRALCTAKITPIRFWSYEMDYRGLMVRHSASYTPTLDDAVAWDATDEKWSCVLTTIGADMETPGIDNKVAEVERVYERLLATANECERLLATATEAKFKAAIESEPAVGSLEWRAKRVEKRREIQAAIVKGYEVFMSSPEIFPRQLPDDLALSVVASLKSAGFMGLRSRCQ